MSEEPREPICACGHGLHQHDNEADPPLCQSCGDYGRCDQIIFCGIDVAAMLATVERGAA